MEYVKTKDLPKRLEGKSYASISCTGSVRGMKKTIWIGQSTRNFPKWQLYLCHLGVNIFYMPAEYDELCRQP